MATLSKTWVLQQKLEQHDNGLEQVLPLEELRLTLLPDGSYQILRHKAVPGAPAGLQTVEEGRWELNASRGLIGMQTKYVDGRSILTTMMYRWEIEELSEERLVLKQFIMGPAYLVLHAEADAKK